MSMQYAPAHHAVIWVPWVLTAAGLVLVVWPVMVSGESRVS